MRKRSISEIVQTRTPSHLVSKLKVCAYIRVSTEHEKQLNSLENQRQYYERLINANPEYEFCGIFSDAGISGAKENRPGFQSMLAEARNGGLNLILTKSISRFARNTVLLLESVRELKMLGVGVIFEEHHINTLSSDGELMLTVLASIAEEEHKSVCGNVQWAIRSRYKRGCAMIDTNRLIGYDKDENGNLVINEEQAEIVRLIFKRYLDGIRAYQLAKELNSMNIPTYTNKPWSSSRILRIVSNEKYKGGCLMQKSFVDERGKSVRNEGQRDQYYIEGNHPALISKELWQSAQCLRESRKPKSYPFSGRLHCPLCGAVLIRKASRWGVDWECGTYLHNGKAACTGIRIPEDILDRIAAEHFHGHWVVTGESNEAKSKREKSYTLVPAAGYPFGESR
ncbi:recombinase family protein [Caproicibacterium amylolyticum]|uniref:Recombinase family protein n=1 Tax=Caproicibacterium amylolyticum TaxID=2766537 RepID=A0A7G9WGQ8_9FIRM|nr:recombinase family protein [Caproicibacterium amylolyticum]QNO17870.1 recombinase family protein [Caproicibacterium amylolyticum]